MKKWIFALFHKILEIVSPPLKKKPLIYLPIQHLGKICAILPQKNWFDKIFLIMLKFIILEIIHMKTLKLNKKCISSLHICILIFGDLFLILQKQYKKM